MAVSLKSPPFSTVTRHLSWSEAWTACGVPGVRRVSDGRASVETIEVPRRLPAAASSPPWVGRRCRWSAGMRVAAPSEATQRGVRQEGRAGAAPRRR